MAQWTLKDSLSPLWMGDVMKDESFTVVRDPEEEVVVSLLHPVEEILSLTDATRELEAVEVTSISAMSSPIIVPSAPLYGLI